jgi:hypothetical protein
MREDHPAWSPGVPGERASGWKTVERSGAWTMYQRNSKRLHLCWL